MAATDRALPPFLAGLLAGAAAAVLTRAVVAPRRTFDPRLLRRKRGDVTPVVLVPGVLGSGLHRPDGTQVWLSMQNALRHHDLQLPLRLPLTDSRDELVPGALLGTRALMPRLFGFTEYAELVEVLEQAGFRERKRAPRYHVFAYDWRRDVVEAARNLGATLDALAEARGEPDARFSMIGHSMGGLVARYYLRYGTAEPGGPVTWAGARRIRTLVLAVSPNGGSIPALEAILNGERIGLSTTTLAPEVISRMPSMYQLMPPAGTHPLLSPKLEPLSDDLHDVATWQRYGWGPYAPGFASPEPELEPQGLRSSACGFLVCPPRPLQPDVEWAERMFAHSERLVLPSSTQPAARSRFTTKLSPGAGAPAKASEPAEVSIRSPVSQLSFTSTPNPWSGPRGPFAMRSASSSSAIFSASGLISITLRSAGPPRSSASIRDRYAWVRARAASSPDCSRACRSPTESSSTSSPAAEARGATLAIRPASADSSRKRRRPSFMRCS